MKCPNCQAPETARVKVCQSCGHAYASEDLLKMQQLEYLLQETADWDGVAYYRIQYLGQLKKLKERILPPPAPEPEPEVELVPEPVVPPEEEVAPLPEVVAVPKPVAEKIIPIKPEKVPEPAPAVPVSEPAPPKEKVPFDQWLLSERNIKIALYSGAVLLVLAGIIFIGVNWTRFSGGLKFAITSLVTALTYFGGYLLYKRPALKLGGNALFGIAGGFFALNFGVLHIYVLRPAGLADDTMWLITSPICLILYMFTAYWTKSDLFTYFSIAAISSTLAAALVVADAPVLVFVLAFAGLITIFLGTSIWLKHSSIAEFTVTPLSWVAQILMPAAQVLAVMMWAMESQCTVCPDGSPFLAIATIGVGVLFYLVTDLTTKRREPRWAISILFTLVLALTLFELDASDTIMGAVFMLEALVYLWVGYWLDKKEGETAGSLPFIVLAYIISLYLTYRVLFEAGDQESQIIILFGDVILLGCSAFIKRDVRWLYGGVWLASLPVYLWADLLMPKLYSQGIVMAGLGVFNLGIGYIVGRRHLKWGGPFLTAAAFLSMISFAMTIDNLLVTSLVLIGWAILYPLVAIWLKWPWLVIPGIIAVNIAVATLTLEYIPIGSQPDVLTISFTAMGLLAWIVARVISRIKHPDWTWPLYIMGTLDLIGAFLASLWLGGWLAIGVSLTLSVLLLVYAAFPGRKPIEKLMYPILPYLGVITLFIGQFYLIDELRLEKIWPLVTAGVCALFASAAWLIKGRNPAKVYELPFRLGGLGLIVFPLIGSVIPFLEIEAWVTAAAFAIGSMVYLVDAGLYRQETIAFLGMGTTFVAHLYLISAAGWVDYWPGITAGICALFAAIAWLMRGRQFAAVFELPFRLGGLGLMLVPVAGSIVDYTAWMAALVFIVGGAIYLIDAGLRRIQWMAFPGVALIFLCQFFVLDEFWAGEWVYWSAITVGVCALFTSIAWLMRGKNLESVFELPFRVNGLCLMIVPLAGTLVFHIPWVSALVFIICGAVFLIDAGLRQFQLMAFLGMGVVFLSHFTVLDIFWADVSEFWPVLTAGVCTLFAVFAWLLRGRKLALVYELPFRLGGLGLFLLPLVVSLIFSDDWVSAIVFSIVGLVYLADAGIRRLEMMAFPGVAVLFMAHFFINFAIWPSGEEYWQPVAAGMSAVFALLSWLVRRSEFASVYQLPFRSGGILLMLIPIAGAGAEALMNEAFLPCALTFGIAAVIYLADAVVTNTPVLGYLGVFNAWVVIWAMLSHFQVTELQAYVLPFGLALLGIGWYERVRFQGRFYRLFTMVGCLIMLGTAFYQSLPRGAWEYALLVGIESILAIGWGIKTQSRGYVQVGGIALIANALIQFIPSFLEWSRWMQIGLTGGILLSLGLLALFKRENILTTREKIAAEWKSWKP